MMTRPILAPFLTFRDEAAIIGRLLAGYTSLEVGLMHCVQVVRDDFDAVLKAMFRPPSAVPIECASLSGYDAMAREGLRRIPPTSRQVDI